MPMFSALSTPPYALAVDSFDRGGGDAATLQAAIDAAQQPGGGGVLLLSPRVYTLEATVVLPSDTYLLGAGAPAAGTAESVPGTIITRAAGSTVLFKAAGTAATPTQSLVFSAITFDGTGASGDLLELSAVSDLRFDACVFQNATGRHLALWQAVGVDVLGCAFLGGGSTVAAAVTVQSGGAYGASQNVSFRGCSFADYPGTALQVSGPGGQGFTIANTSLNSAISDLPALVVNDAATVNLDGLAIVSSGVRGHNILAQLAMAGSIGVFGTVAAQHNPGRGAATYLQSFISLSGGAGAIDLTLFDNDSDPRTAPAPGRAVTATSSVHDVAVRIAAYSSTATPALSYTRFVLPAQ